MSGCTGALIHREITMYSGHCGTDVSWAKFTSGQGGRTVYTDYCMVSPGDFEQGTDWAFCVLSEPVTDIPIIPPAFGCEIDMFIRENQDVIMCGFGESDSGYDGNKRYVPSFISDADGRGGPFK